MCARNLGSRALLARHHALYLTLLLLALATPLAAQSSFHVTLDTSGLEGSHYLEFSLSDGAAVDPGTPDTNNWASISNVTLGGGTLGNTLPPVGNVTGDLASGVTLQDGDPFGVADFAQAFVPGSALEFTLTLAGAVDAGSVADVFRMFLLDDGQFALPTSDPEGFNALMVVQLDHASLGPQDMQGFPTTDGTVVAPAVFEQGPGVVPEGASLWLLLVGLAPVAGCWRRLGWRR